MKYEFLMATWPYRFVVEKSREGCYEMRLEVISTWQQSWRILQQVREEQEQIETYENKVEPVSASRHLILQWQVTLRKSWSPDSKRSEGSYGRGCCPCQGDETTDQEQNAGAAGAALDVTCPGLAPYTFRVCLGCSFSSAFTCSYKSPL